MSHTTATRREVLKTGLTTLALPVVAPAAVLGRDGAAPPSETVRVGVIGCGGRARMVREGADVKGFRIVAACDCLKKRAQGPFSLRMFHRSWGLMMIQCNIEAPCTLLDFPTLDRFIQELKEHQYDVIGIGAIPPSVLKVRKMCEMIRQYQPQATIEQLVGLGVDWIWLGLEGEESQYTQLRRLGHAPVERLVSRADKFHVDAEGDVHHEMVLLAKSGGSWDRGWRRAHLIRRAPSLQSPTPPHTWSHRRREFSPLLCGRFFSLPRPCDDDIVGQVGNRHLGE